MNKDDLKARVEAAINSRKDEIIRIGRTIFDNPELGFKEFKTSALVKDILTSLSIPFEDGIAITGVKGRLHGRARPAAAKQSDASPSAAPLTVGVFGELDAVVCPLHPHADTATGAAHSCGHNSQIAAMLGAAIGLSSSGVMAELDGDVAFLAVPAEEYVELEWRERLVQDGKIVFFGGKQEFIRLGALDDIDMGMMIHSHGGIAERRVLLSPDSSGFVGKIVKYTGKEAHAGAAPFDGVNALNAAMIGLTAINAQRETFKDADRIRVHPIITKGGDMVNIVPADVRMETYVRGRSIAAVLEASAKVNRALQAGAYAVGAEVEIKEIPGYLPLIQNPALNELFGENAARYVGSEGLLRGLELMGATDAGDVSSILPFMHPSTGGYAGAAHSKDFAILDEEMAYVVPAKTMALCVVDLLFDGAKVGREITASYPPQLTKDKYLKVLRGL
ncbi:MAG: amidohydrolase [Treponemataceae bacterium]